MKKSRFSTMETRLGLILRLVLGLGLFCSSHQAFAQNQWEGSATVGGYGILPFKGLYGASNSFPINTLVEIENLENGRNAEVTIVDRLADDSLLVTLSQEAAVALAMTPGSVVRVRAVLVRSALSDSPKFTTDGIYNPDPDIKPGSPGFGKRGSADIEAILAKSRYPAGGEPVSQASETQETPGISEEALPRESEPPRTAKVPEEVLLGDPPGGALEAEAPRLLPVDPSRPFSGRSAVDFPQTFEAPGEISSSVPASSVEEELPPEAIISWKSPGPKEDSLFFPENFPPSLMDFSEKPSEPQTPRLLSVDPPSLRPRAKSSKVFSSFDAPEEPPFSEGEREKIPELLEIEPVDFASAASQSPPDDGEEFPLEPIASRFPEVSEIVEAPEVPEVMGGYDYAEAAKTAEQPLNFPANGEELPLEPGIPQFSEISEVPEVPEVMGGYDYAEAAKAAEQPLNFPANGEELPLEPGIPQFPEGSEISEEPEVMEGYEYAEAAEEEKPFLIDPEELEGPEEIQEIEEDDIQIEEDVPLVDPLHSGAEVDLVLTPSDMRPPSLPEGLIEDPAMEEAEEEEIRSEVALSPEEAGGPPSKEEPEIIVEEEPEFPAEEESRIAVEELVADIVDEEAEPPSAPPTEPSLEFNTPVVERLSPGSHYIQLGVFGNKGHAAEAVSLLDSNYPILIWYPHKSGELYKLLVGPLMPDESGTLLYLFRASGYADAFLRKM